MAHQPPNTEPFQRPEFLSPPKLWLIESKFTNYVVWRAMIYDQFKRDGLLGFIDGTEDPPPSKTIRSNEDDLFFRENPEYRRKSHRRAKEMLLSFIHQGVAPSDPEELETCRDVWLHLKHKFSPLIIRDWDFDFLPDRWPFEWKKVTRETYGRLSSSGRAMSEYMKLHTAAQLDDHWPALHIYLNDVGWLINNGVTAVSAEVDDHQLGGLNNNNNYLFPPYTASVYSQWNVIYAIKAYLFPARFGRSPFVDTARFGILLSAIHAKKFFSARQILEQHNYLAGLKISNKSALMWLVLSMSMFEQQTDTSNNGSPFYRWKRALTFSGQKDFCADHLIPDSWYTYYYFEDKEAPPRWFTAIFFLIRLVVFLTTWLVCICCFPPIILYIPWKFLSTLGFIQKPKETPSYDEESVTKFTKTLCEAMNDYPVVAGKMYLEAILLAAELGVHKIVQQIIDHAPVTTFYLDPVSSEYILHMAVKHRNQHLFKVIYEQFCWENTITSSQSLTGMHGNTMLHLAAKLSPAVVLDKIPGSVLQIQHELKWYKEIERITPGHSRQELNHEGKTPKMMFTDEHKDLKDKAEKWMKDTATSCTIIAALIGTIMFAAAITVPGGNNGNTGFPLFRGNSKLVLFAVFDAISFTTSVISLLMFMEIMMARYEPGDFMRHLPVRIFIGLGSLLISILFMMLTFSVALYLVFGQPNLWVLILVAIVTCNIVVLFAYLQGYLLVQLIASTYSGSILPQRGRQLKPTLVDSNEESTGNLDPFDIL